MFKAQGQAREAGEVKAIVRVSIPLDEARAHLLARGITVRRALNLIRGFAVTASAEQLRALAEEEWITSVEPDREVRAYRA